MFFLLLAGALLVSLLPLPFKIFSALFAIAAIVYGIRYMIAGAQARGGRNWLTLGILGLLACGYLLLGALGTAVMWPVQAEYEECSRSAVTQKASADCAADYESNIKSWFERVTGQPYPG